MKPDDNIENSLKNLDITAGKQLHDRELGKLLKTMEVTNNKPLAKSQPTTWRIIMKSRITKFAAAVVIIFAIIIGISQLGTPFDANQAFADAIFSMIQARTFSCITIEETAFIMPDEERVEYVSKRKYMFQTPDSTRVEVLTSPLSEYVGTITIMDYDMRMNLILKPYDMTATIQDKSSDYVVDEATGKLRLREFQESMAFSIHEQLLEASTRTEVEDMGLVELEGRLLRLLQSQKGNWVDKVWIDPESKLPVQVAFIPPNGKTWLFTSIQIDIELDNDLFSLEPPEGYMLQDSPFTPWSDYRKKINAKITFLQSQCDRYARQHQGLYPSELTDLVAAELLNDKVFKNLLSGSENPVYCAPDPQADPSTEVIWYEAFDQWPNDGILVYFLDKHLDIITEQQRFEELIK